MQITQATVPAAKILLVDDQASSLLLLRELLQDLATLYLPLMAYRPLSWHFYIILN